MTSCQPSIFHDFSVTVFIFHACFSDVCKDPDLLDICFIFVVFVYKVQSDNPTLRDMQNITALHVSKCYFSSDKILELSTFVPAKYVSHFSYVQGIQYLK